MDYGSLLGEAWKVAWRHKYLWIFGLFAFGGGSCSGPSYNFGLDDFGGDTGFSWTGEGFPFGLTILLAILAGVLLLGLVLLVISIIAGGSLIAGVDEAAAGRRPGLADSWRRGLSSFWRILGLFLLTGLAAAVVLVILLALLIVPLVIAAAVGLDLSDGGIPGGRVLWATVAAFLLLGLFLLLVLAAAFVVVRICVNYALRSLVLQGTGVFASLGAGWRLFRHNIGTSLVIWLLNLALSIGVGIVLYMPLFALALPVVIGASALDSVGPVLLVGGALLGLLFVAVVALVEAIGTTFFASYWTIAYRRLTSPAAIAAPVRPGGPITIAPLGKTSLQNQESPPQPPHGEPPPQPPPEYEEH